MDLLYEELEQRKDFEVLRVGFDGGIGVFTKGNLKGMSVIWSFGGGWEWSKGACMERGYAVAKDLIILEE